MLQLKEMNIEGNKSMADDMLMKIYVRLDNDKEFQDLM